mmetsp:Transcript_73527/g.117202  ORF Transcript_73527/g.117202 Transcript_73527/m.117202 type:complete len:201 (+) Transcript_73527:489-1091(+)
MRLPASCTTASREAVAFTATIHRSSAAKWTTTATSTSAPMPCLCPAMLRYPPFLRRVCPPHARPPPPHRPLIPATCHRRTPHHRATIHPRHFQPGRRRPPRSQRIAVIHRKHPHHISRRTLRNLRILHRNQRILRILHHIPRNLRILHHNLRIRILRRSRSYGAAPLLPPHMDGSLTRPPNHQHAPALHRACLPLPRRLR